tara:strand:+ start:5108 stop:6040 length:933 start_codon:yes stop_codon:yes gene_type:complete
MTSLGDNAFVGTLNYKQLVPPIVVGVDSLQATCDIGNTTTTDIKLQGASGSLLLEGSTAPNISFLGEDIRINKATEFKNISIGYEVGTAADNKTVEIGNNITNAGGECVCIGNDIATGVIGQGKFSVAIGKGAGQTVMGASCVAIGTNAGNTNQGTGTLPASGSVAIGFNAGSENQGGSSVAIGKGAGTADQKIECVAVGINAGGSRQQTGAIAIGGGAGASRQGTNSIALGYACCQDTQGNDSIAIGSLGLAFPSGSIGINAGGVVLSPSTLNPSLFINPIRGASNPAGGIANSLWWNAVTKEVAYHIP